MMRCALVGLGLVAGTHEATAQGGWLVHQDSIQFGIYSGGARSVRETPAGFVLFTSQVNPAPPNRTGIQIKQVDQNGLQSSFSLYGLDTISRNLGFIDPVANCVEGGVAMPVLDFLGGGNMYCKGHLFRMDEWGDTLWTKVLFTHESSDSLQVIMRSITQCPDSGFCIAGSHDYPALPGSGEGYLIRTNANGDTLWSHSYSAMREILDIEPYWDGGFILSGYRSTQPDVVTLRVDAAGNELWTRFSGQFGGNSSCIVTNDSGVVTLATNQNNVSDGSIQLTKWTAAGDLAWQKNWYFGYMRATYDLEELPDGTMIRTMFHAGPAALQKFDANGDSLWNRDYIWFYANYLYDIEQTTDGGFVACGMGFQSGLTGDPHPRPGNYHHPEDRQLRLRGAGVPVCGH